MKPHKPIEETKISELGLLRDIAPPNMRGCHEEVLYKTALLAVDDIFARFSELEPYRNNTIMEVLQKVYDGEIRVGDYLTTMKLVEILNAVVWGYYLLMTAKSRYLIN